MQKCEQDIYCFHVRREEEESSRMFSKNSDFFDLSLNTQTIYSAQFRVELSKVYKGMKYLKKEILIRTAI